MDIQRTLTIVIPDDDDLRRTLDAFRSVQQAVSETCYNEGQPLSAVQLQRAVYHDVKGTLNSQMTITALRLVAGAYSSARRNKRPATRPFLFRHKAAMFLVGQRGRDADFRADGSLSIWTVAGRKHLSYTVPVDFRAMLGAAKEVDSLTLLERNGKLVGRVVVTLEVPEPAGIMPVGIDRNEGNALVAADLDGRVLFVSGRAVKVKNRRNQKTRSRLQQKLAARKAEHKDTRSVRRVLKRLGRKQRNRTRTFAQTAAKQLVQWSPPDAVLVLEDLRPPKATKQSRHRKGTRRRLNQWSYALLEQCIRNKAEASGMTVASVNPASTSQTCARCGLRGVRRKHRFVCPHCGHEAHADINAAVNIRNRYTVLRRGGESSISPEARSIGDAGKLPPLGGSH